MSSSQITKRTSGRRKLPPEARHTEKVFVYLPRDVKRYADDFGLYNGGGSITGAAVLRRAVTRLIDTVHTTGRLPDEKADKPCDAKLIGYFTPAAKAKIVALAKRFGVSESELCLRALQAEHRALVPMILASCDHAEAVQANEDEQAERARKFAHGLLEVRAAMLDPRRT